MSKTDYFHESHLNRNKVKSIKDRCKIIYILF